MAEQMGLEAILAVYDNGFAKGMKGAEQQIVSFQKATEKMATDVQKSYVNAVTNVVKNSARVVGAAGAAFGAFAIKSAAEAQVVEAQYAQSFKGIEDSASISIAKMSKDFDILPERMMEPMARLQAYFKGTGMEAADALGLTENAMILAADGAAYFDKSLEDIYGSLKGFLMGNYQNGDAIGVNTNLTKIATAYNKKYGESFQDLSDAAQADFLLEYIQSIYDASGITGQAARESEEWGNVLGNLQKSIEIFASTAGEPLLEPLIVAMQELTQLTLDATVPMKDFIETLSTFDTIGDKAGYIWDLIEPIHALLAVGGTGIGLAAMLPVLGQVGGGVGVLSDKLAGIGKSANSGIGGALDNLDGLKGMLGNVAESSTGLTSVLAGTASQSVMAVGVAGGSVLGIANVTMQALVALAKASMAAFNIAAIGGVILAGAGYFYQKFQSEIDTVINKIIQSGPSMIQGLASSILSQIPTLISSGAQLLSRLIEMFAAIGPVALESGMSIIFALVQGIIDNMDIISGGISQLIAFIMTSIGTYLPTIILMGAEVLLSLAKGMMDNQAMLSDAFGVLVAGLIVLVSDGLPVLFDIGRTIITILANGIIDNADGLMELVVTLLTTFIDQFVMFLPFLITVGGELLGSLVKGLWDNRQPLMNSAMNIVNLLLTFLAEGLPKMIIMGLQLILWLVQGLYDNRERIGAGAEAVIYALIGTLGHMLWDNREEILSLGWQIAKLIIKGLLEGVIDEMANVLKVISTGMKDIADFYIDGYVSLIPGMNEPINNSSGGGGSSRSFATMSAAPGDSRKRSGDNINPVNTTSGKQPAYINMSMNGSTYNGFADDINQNNESQARLRDNY